VIGSEPWNERGPDIAFLRLPAAVMTNLERIASVVNGDLHRQNIITGLPKPTRPFNVICGVVDERTRPTLVKGPVSVTPFEALLNLGHAFALDSAAGMDLFRFQPIAGEGEVLPTSYKGTSGGGLWQLFLDADDFSFVQATLSGVAFWEKRVGNELHIVGHGQRTIYGALLNEITKKWPATMAT
jgi:hypothetical protein